MTKQKKPAKKPPRKPTYNIWEIWGKTLLLRLQHLVLGAQLYIDLYANSHI